MFTKLANILPKQLERLALADVVQAAQVVDYWLEALDKTNLSRFAEYAEALHLKDGLLTIKVTSNAAAQELQLNKLGLLEAYNSHFSSKPVRDLRFRTR